MKPTIGRIVHYYGPVVGARPYAAIVTDVVSKSGLIEGDYEEDGYLVYLTVFADATLRSDPRMTGQDAIPYAPPTSRRPLHWTWPPREP